MVGIAVVVAAPLPLVEGVASESDVSYQLIPLHTGFHDCELPIRSRSAQPNVGDATHIGHFQSQLAFFQVAWSQEWLRHF